MPHDYKKEEKVHNQMILLITFLVILAVLVVTGYKAYQESNTSTKTTKVIMSTKKAPQRMVAKTPQRENQVVTNMRQHSASGRSPSSPVVFARNTGAGLTLTTDYKNTVDSQGKNFAVIRGAVDGMGTVPPVVLNDKIVSPVVTQTAIEDNKDFYPRVDESHVVIATEQQFDSSNEPQDEMFSPMPPNPFGFG